MTLEELINLQLYHMKMKIIMSWKVLADLLKIIITPTVGFCHNRCSIAVKSTQS